MKRKILIVPDKFKGSATAEEVAVSLERALRMFCVSGRNPNKLDITVLPLADGGDGSMEVLLRTLGDKASVVEEETTDALGRPVRAGMLLFKDTAFIEMAKVCGLAMLAPQERNPEITTTFGLGTMLAKAAGRGVKRIILSIGGSATNDGGAGILEACPPEMLEGIELLVACDVTNPLLGPDGATMVYGPQKGADRAMLERLERRMEAFAAKHNIDTTFPGGGAAGGVGALMHSVYGAELVPGWKLFGDMVSLEQRISEADLVISAEGRFDGQSLSGKLIDGIAGLCVKHHKQLKIVCGRCTLPFKEWKKAGISDVFTLSEIEQDIHKSIARGRELLSGESIFVAGCDEAGRGCLAGPVFAAAVVLPDGFYDERLNDSKQMSEADRDALRVIIEREALAWCVVAVSASEIDRINILNASIAGMQHAVSGIISGCGNDSAIPVGSTAGNWEYCSVGHGRIKPQMILVDGNRFLSYRTADGTRIPHHCVIHGDARIAAIAAASVLAKTHRDEYMRRLAKDYPQYGWDRNMAYPTAEHRDAIRRYGITPHHRRSYTLLPEEDNKLF